MPLQLLSNQTRRAKAISSSKSRSSSDELSSSPRMRAIRFLNALQDEVQEKPRQRPKKKTDSSSSSLLESSNDEGSP